MADATTTYEQAIQEIESFSAERDVTFVIDTSTLFSNKINFGTFDYEKADAIISTVEGTKREKIEVMQQPAVRIPTPPPEHKEISAGKEIANIISDAGREFEKKVSEEALKLKREKLILPTLSIQDQISDLEKMSEGIDENVFNKEQLDIIKLEVEGMNNRLKYEKQPPNDEFQKSLIALRNKRLQEVLDKLKTLDQSSTQKNN